MVKRAQPERNLHRAVAQYLDWSLPSDAFWWPVPSASHRLLPQAANMKRAGELKPGLPDIMICYRGRLICVELKAPQGRVSPAQREVHDRITLAGGVVCVCRSLEEVADFLVQIIPIRARA